MIPPRINIKEARRLLAQGNKRASATLQPINAAESMSPFIATLPKERQPIAALRSKYYIVQVFDTKLGVRLSISRTEIESDGSWKGRITWDELMQVKREAGYGGFCAVEIYPEDQNIVNDANIRHLFVLWERPPFAWTKENSATKRCIHGAAMAERCMRCEDMMKGIAAY